MFLLAAFQEVEILLDSDGQVFRHLHGDEGEFNN